MIIIIIISHLEGLVITLNETITTEGLGELATHAAGLHTLSIEAPKLGDDEVCQLVESCKSLQHLELGHCDISEK